MKSLYSLNASTGKPNLNLQLGQVKIKRNCSITPVIIRDQLIIATFEPTLEVYNIKTGELNWKYYLKEKINQDMEEKDMIILRVMGWYFCRYKS